MRLRNLFMILLLCMTVGIFSACTGDDGATGPQGPQGDPGTVDVEGIVDEVIDQIGEGEMANPDNCTIFADRSRSLVGSNRDDIMCGNERNNTIRGGDGDDTIFGREGKDTLEGQGDDDILYGGDGDDTLDGGSDSDELYGEAGNDKLIARGDDDILDGGEGADMVVYNSEGVSAGANMFFSVNLAEGYAEKKSRLSATDGSALTDGSRDSVIPSTAEIGAEGEILEDLIDIENIWGSASPDLLIGDENDNLIGGDAGADHIDGGAGTDTADYMGSDAVVVSLVAGASNTGGHAAGDVLVGIENVRGGAGADSITGNNADNVLSGMDGVDTLVGGAGNDTIVPGKGDDATLTGGDGADRFVIAKGDGNNTITDFDATEGDKLVLVGFSAEERNARTTTFESSVFTIAGQTVTLTGVTNFRETSDIIWQ